MQQSSREKHIKVIGVDGCRAYVLQGYPQPVIVVLARERQSLVTQRHLHRLSSPQWLCPPQCFARWSLGVLSGNPDQVSAEAFCRVQRLICDFQELLTFGGMNRGRRDADTGGDPQLLAAPPAFFHLGAD